MDVRPPTLSGGQQQRVAIARAVISRPKILYADEPTGNVDSRIAARLMHLFEELNKLGTTVVIATHNESIVNEFGRPVLRIDAGRLKTIPNEGSQGKSKESKLKIISNSLNQGEAS
jgi:cell division transport system ATP-binding protein